MKYVDCKARAQEILTKIKESSEPKKALTILSVGDNPASQSYVKGKIKDCDLCGIPYNHIKIDAPMLDSCVWTAEESVAAVQAQSELQVAIEEANADDSVGGIIVQLPLPDYMHEPYWTSLVVPEKDVDGFTDKSPFIPCTPEGVIDIITQTFDNPVGLNTLIVGRGNLVGGPLSTLLSDVYQHTVTVSHSHTRDLDAYLESGLFDVIVAAAGRPGLVNLQKCNTKLVIDVGVNRDENGKLCGDCYGFDPDDGNDMLVTPVPGGIGLMTRAMLMEHVARASGVIV